MMKYLILLFASIIVMDASAQIIPAEDFATHIRIISENEEILKKYKVEDEEGNRVIYVNLGNYSAYHQKEPIKNRFGDVYIWDEGTIAFYKIPYALDLLRIREEGDNLVFYELTYDDGKEKNYMEIKFVKRYKDWELVNVAISKIKKAY